MLRALGLFALSLVCACGDEVAPADSGADTSSSDAAPDASAPLTSPVAPPAPPDFTECPDGWRRAAHPTVASDVCEPWPEGGPADCAPHEMHLPGAAGCARIGSACPADGWPVSLPATGVVFVSEAAAAGGDGSRSAPFRTVVDAAASIPDGGTIAVAVGEYDGRVDVPGPITIIGACAEGVVLHRMSGSGGLPIVNVTRGGSFDVRDVTLRSAQQDRFLAMFGSVRVRDAIFDGVGIVQFGGSATIEDVRFSGLADDSLSLVSITGVDSVSVARVVVHDTDVGGMTLLANEGVTIADVAIRATGGIGLQLNSVSSVDLRRVVVEDATGIGVTVDGRVVGADVVVRGVQGDGGPSAGLASIGDAELTRVRAERTGDVAMSFLEGNVTVSDLVVDGGGRGTGYSRGLELGDAVRCTLRRVAIASVNDLAFLVSGEGTSVVVEDATVDDVASGPGGGFGRCLHAQLGAAVTSARTSFSRCREAAVTASTGASIEMRDAVLGRILPIGCATADCPDAQAGIGFVALEGGGSIDAERFEVSEAALAAVQVIAGGSIDLRDGTIRDNPVGINVQVDGYDLARLMDRVVFENNGLNLDSSELPVPAATTTASTP